MKKASMVYKIENMQDENLEDILLIAEKNINRYFAEIENSVSHFQHNTV